MMQSAVVALPREPLPVPIVRVIGREDRESRRTRDRVAEVRLEWEARHDDRRVDVTPDALTAFVALARVPEGRLVDAVFHVAEAWGPLFAAVCVRERGRLTHPHNPVDLDGCTAYAAPFGPLTRARAGREPVGLWRQLAERFSAISDVAASLRSDEIGDRRRWAVVTRMAETELKFPHPVTVEDGRNVLQAAIRDLYIATSVRLVLGVEPTPVLTLTGDGLLGALAVQLSLRISGTEASAVCAECGALVPDRKPDTRRAFCAIHRTPQIKNKWAARDHRRRAPKTSEGETP